MGFMVSLNMTTKYNHGNPITIKIKVQTI